MMNKPPDIINRAFAGLFQLFGIPGVEKPADQYKELLEFYKKHQNSPPQTEEEYRKWLSDHTDLIENFPPLDPGPSVWEIAATARSNELSVIQLESVISLTGLVHGIKLELSIKDSLIRGWMVQIEAISSDNGEAYFDAEYWKSETCPMLLCRMHINPISHHNAIVENLRLKLVKLDRDFCGDALSNQTIWWGGSGD